VLWKFAAFLIGLICLGSPASGEVTGTIEHHTDFPSGLVSPRHVDVWLPPSYGAKPNKRYPVIYMHDGQNLFDPSKSFLGVDWGVDETMTRLIKEGKIREAIVVAIWNTPHRTREYLPARPFREGFSADKHEEMFKFLGSPERPMRMEDFKSDEYLKFLVTELKPFIDKTYRTQPECGNTFIMGSSAGAFISLYAICEYPNVFGGAGSVSGHYPLGDGMFVDAFANRLPDPRCHKLYFDFGTETLDKDYERFQWRMDEKVAHRGYVRGCNWLTCKFAGADHSERSWRERVDIPLEFFLRKESGRVYPRHWWSKIDDAEKPDWEILPHEAKPGEVILSKRNELGLLSNFAATPFEYCGKKYASLEGFWQAMKYPEGPNDERAKHPDIEWQFTRDEVALMSAFEAKAAGDLGSANMRKMGIDWVTFNGKRFPYRPMQPGEHFRLIADATRAKVFQNPTVSSVLTSTGDLILKPDHYQEDNPPAAWRYYDILTAIRDEK
jgi:predicted alpha/beta superfamily hydrolase